ncbi:MAG: hypothetical protein ACI82Z_001364 [Cellvibrionaceae bacterium]|jgi:hypothetical protein
MYNTNIPSDRELPSISKLIKSTILAAVTAGILLVTVVMPSEYGIDPTGLGEMTGLKRMGEIKISLAEEAEADADADADAANITDATKSIVEVVETEAVEIPPVPAPNNTAYQNHKMTFTLAPDEGTEVKVTMAKGAKVDYIWETNGGKSNFDVHGDSKKLKIKYHPYYKGSDSKREGTLDAAFDGGHGWFWRNRTKQPLTITIKTNGEYTDIKRY